MLLTSILQAEATRPLRLPMRHSRRAFRQHLSPAFPHLENLEDRTVPSAGFFDPSFGGTGKILTPLGTGNDTGLAATLQPDGKIVVVGYSGTGSKTNCAVVRYNIDGTLDSTFSGDGMVTTAVGPGADYATSVALQTDGKIVIAGYSHNGTNNDFAVLRYNPDGSLDSTFSGDGIVTTAVRSGNDYAYTVTVQADGKIVVAGHSSNGVDLDFAVVRYNPDGSLDTTFSSDGIVTTAIGTANDQIYGVAVQSDGKIVVAGSAYIGSNNDFALARYNSDGSLDSSFSGDGKLTTPVGVSGDVAYGLALQADGRIVAAGYSHNGTDNDFTVIRYTSGGALDSTFSGDGIAIASFGGQEVAYSVAIQPDGRILLAGEAMVGSPPNFALARFTSSGNLDPTFDGDGLLTTSVGSPLDTVRAVAVQADGKIVAAGWAENGSNTDFALVRYHSDGSLDPLLNGPGWVSAAIGASSDTGYAVAIQPDGKIVVAGFSYTGTHYDPALARFLPNGALDTSFSDDGKIILPTGSGNDFAYSVAIQPDGKIVVAGPIFNGTNTDFGVIRFTSDGSLDTTFSDDGIVTTAIGTGIDNAYGVAVQPDGKIVVAGYSSNGLNHDFAVVRYTSIGTLDPSFSFDGIVTTAIGSGDDIGQGLALQSDGKIVVAGYYSNGVNYDFAVVRYNSDGSLDPTFDSDGRALTPIGTHDDQAQSVIVQPDGKIVVAGYSYVGNRDVSLVRFTSSGSLDSAFSSDGKVLLPVGSSDDLAHSVALQPDGRIIVAGTTSNGSDWDFLVLSFNPDGSLDSNFHGDGIAASPLGPSHDQAYGLAIQPDGKIVVVGTASVSGNHDFAVARLFGYDNRAPITVPTTWTVHQDTPLTVVTPTYVYDPEGNALTTELLYAPAHGSLQLTPYGTFTYTPAAGFFGTDRFAYRVADTSGAFAVGSIVFEVVPLARRAADPSLAGKLSLFVTGTPGNDVISVKPSGTSLTTYIVTRNGQPAKTFTGITGRIFVDGLDGNDSINLSTVKIATVLEGGAGNDTLTGGSAADTLRGSAGNDILVGGAGNDRLTGGWGDDRLDGGTGTDRLVEIGDVDFELVQGTTTTNGRLTGLGNDVLVKNTIETADLTGGDGNNIINAAAFTGRTWITGGNGNDTLHAGKGNSIVLGGLGEDAIYGNLGRDILIGGLGTDIVNGGTGEDILIGGTTSHDENRAALDALMAEWSRTTVAYAMRIKRLMGTATGGLNGTYKLTTTGTPTVFSDTLTNTLTGGAGLDWFWAFTGDAITDLNTGGTEKRSP